MYENPNPFILSMGGPEVFLGFPSHVPHHAKSSKVRYKLNGFSKGEVGSLTVDGQHKHVIYIKYICC